MTKKVSTNNYSSPKDTVHDHPTIVDTLFNRLATLKRMLALDTERWIGKNMPDNVKEDRKDKRRLINSLQKQIDGE